MPVHRETTTDGRLGDRRPHPRPWLRGSVFDPGGAFRRPLDRRTRARLIERAERLERATKARGKRDGAIGQSGLAVLRALLFHFLNPETGRLDPSYVAIQARTGLCVATIGGALRRLAACGILETTRRLVRVAEWAVDALTGRRERRARARQDTNAYRLNFPYVDRPAEGDLEAPLLGPAGVSARRGVPTPASSGGRFAGVAGGTRPPSTSSPASAPPRPREPVPDPALRGAPVAAPCDSRRQRESTRETKFDPPPQRQGLLEAALARLGRALGASPVPG